MEKYCWDKEKIIASNLDEQAKEIILGELDNKPISSDPNVINNSCTLNEYKKAYFKLKKDLLKMYPELYKQSLELYKYFKPDNFIPYNLIVEDDFLSPENIISVTNDFFKSINDPEILKVMNIILNPQNNIINFKQKNENVISSAVHGRAIKIPHENKGYISMYLGSTIEDATVFAHECGHLLTHMLYCDNINPEMKIFSEVESYYFELLMMDFIKKELDNPSAELTDLLMSNRLLKTIYYIWDIKIQDIICHTLGNKILIDKLNKKIHKCKTNIEYTREEIGVTLANPISIIFPLVNSYLIALELYNKTKEDKEKGLYIYKSIMQETKMNLLELLKKYDMDYYNNYKSLSELYIKSLELKMK